MSPLIDGYIRQNARAEKVMHNQHLETNQQHGMDKKPYTFQQISVVLSTRESDRILLQMLEERYVNIDQI